MSVNEMNKTLLINSDAINSYKQIPTSETSPMTGATMLSQLTVPLIASRTPGECRGLLQFFLGYRDEILKRYQADDPRFELHDLDAYSVADRLIFRLLQDKTDDTLVFLTEHARGGRAWCWMAEYVRHLLWQHGMAGDVSKDDQEEWMALGTLETFRDALGARLNSTTITDTLEQ